MKHLLGMTAIAFVVGTASLAGLGCDGDDGSGGSAGNGGSGAGSATEATGGSGASNGTGAGNTGGSGAGNPTGGGAPGGIFEVPEPWTKSVSGLPPSERSDAIISTLESLGGWGTGEMQVDFAITLLYSDASTPRLTVTGDPDDYCYGGIDCDPVPLQMPIPENGNAEGQPTYDCPAGDEDCHILVYATDEKKLYELYSATADGDGIFALGAFIWDVTKQYPDDLRGEQCTSADAAGFPVAGLLPTAEEVATGEVKHAIRFILPNPRMKAGVYVHPASHAGNPTSDEPDAPPYGVRFRLKADFDESGFNDGERVILHAMKTYGMLLSDGGQIALTFGDDRHSSAKWDQLGITAQSFSSLAVGDFEVVDLGPEIELTYDCVLNP